MAGAPIVVTGLGAHGAAGDGVEALVATLRAGTALPSERSDETTGRTWPVFANGRDGRAELAAKVGDAGDPAVRRMSRKAPKNVLSAANAAVEAWRMAGLPMDDPDGRHAIVAAAQNTSGAVLAAALQDAEAHAQGDPWLALLGLDSFVVGWLSALLGMRGEGAVAGAAQASGHAAVLQAVRLLEAGAADAVLVVGVAPELTAPEIASYGVLGLLGTNSRPFDAGSDGFVPGETAAALVLERADTSQRRGSAIATVSGCTMRLHGTPGPDPDGVAEAAVMDAALRSTGLAPEEIDLVCAHATGTSAGDAAEAGAILRTLGEGTPVNAPKAILGHNSSAAGVVETVASCLQIRDGFVHGMPRLETPRLRGPAYQRMTDERPLRHVLNTGFGFGGQNAAMVLSHPR